MKRYNLRNDGTVSKEMEAEEVMNGLLSEVRLLLGFLTKQKEWLNKEIERRHDDGAELSHEGDLSGYYLRLRDTTTALIGEARHQLVMKQETTIRALLSDAARTMGDWKQQIKESVHSAAH